MDRTINDQFRSWYEDPIVRGLLRLALRLRIGTGLDLIEEALKSSKKGLIVGHDFHSRGVLRQQLNDLGYSVAEVSTNLEAFELAKKETPDFIILDIMMPDFVGRKVVSMLRTVAEAKQPIIILAAMPRREDAQAFLDAGFDDILSKPFNLNKLRDKLQQLLGSGKYRPSRLPT